MLLLLLPILISLIILLVQKRKKRYEQFWKHIMKIPGPKYYPILGTNYKLYTPESLFIRDRKRAKEFYPIYKVWVLNNAYINLISPDDIEQILTNINHINKGNLYTFLHDWLGDGLLTSGGSKWHKRRKTLTPAFHFNMLQEIAEIINRETKELVKNLYQLSSQPYINVIKPITEFTLYSIGETAMGNSLRKNSKCTEYKQAVYDIGKTFTNRAAHPWLWFKLIYDLTLEGRRNKQIVKTLHSFSMHLIQTRKKTFMENYPKSYSEKKRLALLDLMLISQENGEDIDDKDVREEVDTFVFGGHDTTSLSLSFTLMALANEQEIQEEIYQEIISILGDSDVPTYSNLNQLTFMERCIKESLRLYPPAPLISRICGEEVKTKSGYIIPKGCDIKIHIFDLHRSPGIWENPLKFDPDRFLPDNISKRHPFAFLPFSAGRRNCIGQRYALLQLKIALCGILKHFKLEPIDKPEDITFKADLVLRPSGEIRVKFVPRIKNC